MRRPSFPRVLALVFGGAFLVGACTGGGASSAPSVAASAPASTAAASAAVASVEPSVAPTELPGTKTFSVGATSAGFSHGPLLAAIDSLRSKGYKIDYPVLDSSELVTQGVASGQFAFGSGANNSVMAAITKGANLRLVVARVNNEWTLYALNSIKSCADLAGKKLAIHSAGAVSTAMVKNYVATKCPGTEPDYVVIPGSENRVKALLANQIDASPLELGDALTIDAKASDRYHQLSNFSADLPDLQTTSVYVNGDFAKANPGTVVALIEALLEQFRKADPAYLKEIATKYVPDTIDPTTIDAQAARYAELKMFPVNGGITDANLTYTAKFFGPKPDGTGSVDKLLAVSDFADLSYLKIALDALGTK